jgi:hypothetical protein
MIPDQYREFFTATASTSGALIGLLFVAITVAPERERQEETRMEFRVRASVALLVFSNALSISLAALIPMVSLGWWCLVSSFGILLFAAATMRSTMADRRRPGTWRPVWLIAGLLVVVLFESWAGVRLVRDESDLGAIRILNYVLIADLLMGIGRAWQLASMRETGPLSSLRVLARGEAEAVALGGIETDDESGDD